MHLSQLEIKIMNHMQMAFPKPSSVKQLTDATKNERNVIEKTLKALETLNLLTVGTKKEVWLRKDGKEYLGVDVQTTVKKPKLVEVNCNTQEEASALAEVFSSDIDIIDCVDVDCADSKNALLLELNSLAQQLTKPAVTIKGKTEKVDLLRSLSDKLIKSTPHISKELSAIANVLSQLEEAA